MSSRPAKTFAPRVAIALMWVSLLAPLGLPSFPVQGGAFERVAYALDGLGVSVAHADALPPPEDVAESRSTEFRAVTRGQGEDVPGGNLLVAAYGAVLVLLLAYVVYLGRIGEATRREADHLEQRLKQLTAKTDGKPSA